MHAGSRPVIFWLQVAYLLALFAIGYLYWALPSHLWIPEPLRSYQIVPIAVPWFGALGAVLISLTGVIQHAHDWDESLAFWHWSRPIVGAVMAVVAVLILQAGILSVGGSPQAPSQPVVTSTSPSTPRQQTPQNPILFYVIGFVVAYREETFRELIKRAADVILTPGSTPVPPSATALNPQTGPLAGNTQVAISGQRLTSVTRVTFGTRSALFRIDSDTQITTVSPAGPAAGNVPVVVSAPGGNSAAGQFTYT